MSYIVINQDLCKGCLLCVGICPKSIIKESSIINRKGYKIAHVPEESMSACTACASCALTCPDVAIEVYRTTK